MQKIELIEIPHPRADLDLARQSAELILEIGNYKESRDVDMILEAMAARTTVAAVDGYDQVVGTAGVRCLRPGVGMLEDVVSDPNKRGEGIGRKVVEAAETTALSKGILELELASSFTAIPFYEHLGYQRLGERLFRKFL